MTKQTPAFGPDHQSVSMEEVTEPYPPIWTANMPLLDPQN